jgi:4-diphosphocytidyl-2-C-methyl-D-erythritol kinase
VTTASSPVRVRVPAKVNLRLSVGPAHDDGYHALVNVFQAVALYDEVTVERAPEGEPRVRLGIDGDAEARSLPVDGANLAVRAAELLARETGAGAAVRIHVSKAIPVAGGMAGGSADAAATLLACDTLWGTGLGAQGLARLAARLGADVPFALLGGTAVGTGRGDILTPLPDATTCHWVFALASAGLSTAEVYRTYDRLRPHAPPPSPDPDLERALRNGEVAALGTRLANDLQPAALALRPELETLLQAGRDAGALGAVVSGSGPSCAFLAEDPRHAATLAETLRRGGHCSRTVTAAGPVPGARILPE